MVRLTRPVGTGILVALVGLFVGLFGCGGESPPNRVDAQALRQAAETWIGTPHRIGGRDRRGIDCSGLALALLEPLGAQLPRRAEDMRRQGRRIPTLHVQPGDLLFFRTDRADGLKGHVGIALGARQFIHATASQGVIVSSLDSPWWGPRFREARRVLP